MLDGSPNQNDNANIGNVENNNPISPTSSSDGLNAGNKSRQTLLKKGGRRLRSSALLHHQKPPRNGPSIRLSDHNNNPLTASSANKPAPQPGAELPVGTQTLLTHHHLKHGAKKEVTSWFVLVCHPRSCTVHLPVRSFSLCIQYLRLLLLVVFNDAD